MKKPVVKAYFHKNRLRKKDGRSVLYLLIYFRSKRTYYPLGFYVDPLKFDSSSGKPLGRSKESTAIRKRLVESKKAVMRIFRTHLRTTGVPPTPQEIKEALYSEDFANSNKKEPFYVCTNTKH